MDKATVISCLKSHEGELRRMGVASLSLFGSTARGDGTKVSDIDLAARFAEDAHVGLFAFNAIYERLNEVLGTKVDLVGEPARRPWMQDEIDRDRVHVF